MGLNLKNFTKKVHIPDYVRFVKPNTSANALFDLFNHDRHARGSHHVRKHWEYSEDCYKIIKQYKEKFPEVIEMITRKLKGGKAMNSLKDLYPDLGKEEAIEELKKILNWLEALPISKMPYVEIGFDALDLKLVQSLQDHSEYMLESYHPINLDVKKTEELPLSFIYQEHFPFWCGPFPIGAITVDSFRVGNRVMNLNSTRRKYIPFGFRGTVVGKTD